MARTPYYQDDLVTLWHGDCLEVLPELSDNSVDAVVTDPPYGLEFMGKDWDSFRPSAARIRKPSARDETPGAGHNASTFLVRRNMPDAYVAGAAFQAWCEQWAAECLRILKPGGHLLAFGGTRTSHRLACAVEDAGFEIRDSIAWLYGSGFPKSLDVSKAIDRAAGAEREVIGPGRWNGVKGTLGRDGGITPDGYVSHGGTQHDITAPATPEAEQWQGWGTALKPAHEPIIVARKPLTGTVAANVLRWGTGALNIDAGRIESGPVSGGGGWAAHQVAETEGWDRPYVNGVAKTEAHDCGRWPANVALDESQAAALDQQSGELTSGSRQAGEYGLVGYHGSGARPMPEINGDSGGASRFFYTAKASSGERITHDGTSHPTVKPLSLMRWLVRLVTPPGGVILEPFAGSGTTVEAALLEGFRCIAIEREADYLPLITQRINRRRDPIAYLTAAGDDLGLFGGVA